MANGFDLTNNPLQGYMDKLNGIPPEPPAGGTKIPMESGVVTGGEPPIPPGAGGGKAAGIFSGLLSKEGLQSLFLWQVVGQLVGGAMQPLTQGLSRLAEDALPMQQLAPAELADAVVRGFWTEKAAEGIARQSGVNGDAFKTMVQLAGDAPSPGDLAVALRRNLIPDDSGDPNQPGFVQGIQQGRLADKWIDMIKGLSVQWPSPTDALDAYLEGQIDQATAEKLYHEFGGDPQFFTMLYNTRGSAPTPIEAADMANRGIIPWTGTGPDVVSYQQAFLEGPWRNKWLDPYRQVAERLPTAPEVRSMLSQGVIDNAQAVSWLHEMGMKPAVAEAFLHEASSTKTSKAKDLAMATVETLYFDQLIDRASAVNMLSTLGYNAQEADFVLSIQDLKRTETALNQAVSKLHTLYIDHKIDRNNALGALQTLKIPANQISGIMSMWDLEAGANVKSLTQSEIVDLFHYQIIDQATAQGRLQHLGYLPHDAWLLLSLKEKSKLPAEPPITAVNQTLPNGVQG